MTREEIMSMNSGRELDVLIAKNVMGHEVFVEYTNYSTDVSAAWEIVEKFNGVIIDRCDIKTGWRIGLAKDEFVTDSSNCITSDNLVEADTAPHAICLAALIAVMEVE